jgi:Protein of unknown function (DUF4238)
VKHHYVPAFYLRGFVDPACPPGYEPYVWVVDLDEGKSKRKSPENAAYITDYYAVGDGDNRQDVETEYLQLVDGLTAPVVAKILADHAIIDADDKATLSYFAALQIVRVPQFRERIEEFMTRIAEATNIMLIRDREAFEEGLRASHPGRTFTAEEVEQIYTFARDPSNYSIKANPEAALGHALDVVPKIAAILHGMSWAIMEPAGPENFWTSDNPLFYINPQSKDAVLGHGLLAKNIEVNLPLGPRRCLFMAWSRDIDGPTRIPLKDVRCAQERGIVGAKRYLFCSTEADAEAALAAHRRLYPRRHQGEGEARPDSN